MIPLPDLSVRQLLAVLTVAEQGSFVAAAAVLKMSQPALTRVVRRVEDVLGAALFERTTRRVRLTQSGRDFLPVAERLLNELRIAARSLRENASEARGRVTLACIMSAVSGPLPAILAAWTAVRPGVEVVLHEGVHGAVLQEVRSGAADFGLTYVDDLPDDMAAQPLGRERFVLVAPPAHHLAQREGTVALREVAGERLVSFPSESRTRHIIDAAATKAGLTLRHAVTVSQFATMLRLVRAGAGLAIVPGSAVAGPGGEGLAVLALARPGLTRRIGLLMLRARAPGPVSTGLLGALRDGWPGSAINA